MVSSPASIDFNNTEIAFQSRSTSSLRKAQALFHAFNSRLLVETGPKLIKWALQIRLPITPIIKATIFDQFCGGVAIDDCSSTVATMARFGVGSILDYSAEGQNREEDFSETVAQVKRVIVKASHDANLPFAVFKMTGLARLSLLEKVERKETLTTAEKDEFARARLRVHSLCQTAFEHNVRLLIDAEETWIQDTLDELVLSMMQEFNKEQAIVFNSLQMYRHDRLDYLKAVTRQAAGEGFYLGIKLVRGAYMEKERERAARLGYPSPIHPDKQSTDRAFDEAVAFTLENIDRVAIFIGSHNEHSNERLIKLMAEKALERNDRRVAFSQLFGMSDHLTYNLAHHGYNVSKYVPYGPVKTVLPYLFRRAEENSAIKGQVGRELQLIERELERRHSSR